MKQLLLTGEVSKDQTSTEISIDLTINNDVGDLKKIVPFLEKIFQKYTLDDKVCLLVRSGLDEALTNCVLYAYDVPGGKIDVRADMKDKCLCITIKDSGKPFNPLEYIHAPEDKPRMGGMGIKMMRIIFDEIHYHRENNNNILELIKIL